MSKRIYYIGTEKLRQKVKCSPVCDCEPVGIGIIIYHFINGSLFEKECVLGDVHSVANSINDIRKNGWAEFGNKFTYEVFITDALDYPIAFYDGKWLEHRFSNRYAFKLRKAIGL